MAVRLGSQEPTFSVVGEWHHTFGQQVVSLYRGWGVRLYPCQERELDLFLARDSHNRFACRTICISKPRQNGKSFGVRFYAIECAAVEGRHVLFTAHVGNTVRKMFKFIRAFILHTPDLAQRLLPGSDGIYKAQGSEGIYFANGGLIEFATRTEGGGRGETYDVIIFDEAQHLTDDQYDAIVPTTIASDTGDPQKIFLGTPPGPKCRGTVFRRMHDKVHAGATRGTWWLEWSTEEIPNLADRLGTLETAYRTNPALGYRIREDVMLDAIDGATSTEGFAREFLGWWTPIAMVEVVRPVDRDDWLLCSTTSPPETGDVTYAVKLSSDGTHGAIAVCSINGAAPPHVELACDPISLAGGVRRFRDFLLDVSGFADAIVVDGRGIAQTLVDQLIESGIDDDLIVLPSTSDMTAACASFVDATREHALTHFDQAPLNDAVCGCGRRRIGTAGGFGFQSAEGADATLAEAAALAYWCATDTRRNPPTELRIG